MKLPLWPKLDPAIEEFIKALARAAAQQDHDEIFKGKKRRPVEPGPPAPKSRLKVVLRIADGQGGYRLYQPEDSRRELFQKDMQRLLGDWKAGHHDDLGLSKRLKMPLQKKTQKP